MNQAKLSVGVLCYGLNAASTTTLNALVEEAGHLLDIKAYPNVPGRQDTSEIRFSYRPSTMFQRRYVTFNTLKGDAPEGMLVTVSPSLVWDLVTESDVVCLLGIQGFTGLAATAFAKLRGKPVVTINQTTLPSAERRRLFGIRLAKRWILSVADAVVAQTPPTLDTLAQVYRVSRTDIIYAPWDGGASEFRPVLERYRAIPRPQLGREWEIGLDAYVVLYAGSLIGYKGVDGLVQAFSYLQEEMPEAHLLIAGQDGKPPGTLAKLREQAERLNLRRSVSFLGRLSWEDLAKAYLLADVFVLPTRRDMWPKVLIEAALAGLPLVTTDKCGAAGYMVRNGENGYVVPVDDSVALHQRLLDLTDDSLRRIMGSNSERIVQEYIELSRHESRALVEAVFKAAGDNCEASLGSRKVSDCPGEPSALSPLLEEYSDLNDSGAGYYNNEYHRIRHSALMEDDEYFYARARASRRIIFSNFALDDVRVLDYGCGMGHHIALLPNAWGYDISSVARSACVERDIPVYSCVEEIPHCQWDIILCSHVLEHLENPYVHLRLLHDLLKPDGTLIIILPKESHYSPDAQFDLDSSKHLYCWNFRTIGNLLNRAGFEVEAKRYESVLGFRVLLPIKRLLGFEAYFWAAHLVGRLKGHYWLVVHARKLGRTTFNRGRGLT